VRTNFFVAHAVVPPRTRARAGTTIKNRFIITDLPEACFVHDPQPPAADLIVS
jgi:hypothetical protein